MSELRQEAQADLFTHLAYQDDLDLYASGHEQLVNLWLTEQLCIYGVSRIYGIEG